VTASVSFRRPPCPFADSCDHFCDQAEGVGQSRPSRELSRESHSLTHALQAAAVGDRPTCSGLGGLTRFGLCHSGRASRRSRSRLISAAEGRPIIASGGHRLLGLSGSLPGQFRYRQELPHRCSLRCRARQRFTCGVAGEDIFGAAQSARIGLRSGGMRTGPLGAVDLQARSRQAAPAAAECASPGMRDLDMVSRSLDGLRPPGHSGAAVCMGVQRVPAASRRNAPIASSIVS
jgi:hypothetical protein